jgi:hypothetical protein
MITTVIEIEIFHAQVTDSPGSVIDTTGALDGGGSAANSAVSIVGSTSSESIRGATVGVARNNSGGGGIGFHENGGLMVTGDHPRKRPLTTDRCAKRAKALLQVDVQAAISCTCELNLAQIAQKVTSNGAKAADCKQRRKCLEPDELFLHLGEARRLTRMLS